MSESLQEVIRVERLTFTYFENDKPTLQIANFSVKQGTVTVITGRNGSGKTTLCTLLARAMPSYEGKQSGTIMYRQGKETSLRIGFAFQEANNQLILGTVEDELAFAPENMGLSPVEITQRVETQLQCADLVQLRLRQVYHLSGGEQQRTAVASILTMEPDVLIIDDVWGQLDINARQQLRKQIQAWHRQGKTLILAVSRLTDVVTSDGDGTTWQEKTNVLVLHQGKIIYEGSLAKIERMPQVKLNDKYLIQSLSFCKRGQGAEILRISELQFRYDASAEAHIKSDNILQHIEFTLYTGQCMRITGCNGAGKSTLLQLIANGIPAKGRMSGQIWLRGRPIQQLRSYERAQWIGFTTQYPEHSFFATTVHAELQHVWNMVNEMRCHMKHGVCNETKDQDRYRVLTTEEVEQEVLCQLRQYHLWEVRNRNPQQLSIGLKRMLSLAIVAAHEPALILLDEPTAALDEIYAAYVCNWCIQQAEQGRSLIVATHDLIWQDVYHPCFVHVQLSSGKINGYK